MKIAVFSTYTYDQDFLTRYNTGHELDFLVLPLNEKTAGLPKGSMPFVCL